jgi:Zn-finger nucleic acid-binding protein
MEPNHRLRSKRAPAVPELFDDDERVPIEGPELDLCRGCQLMWFDAGELEAMPHRSAESIAGDQKAERWAQKQREWRRRRESDEARHPIVGPWH